VQGVVFLGDRRIELREVPDPTPGPRDVVLEVKASGMCGTDLKLYHGDEMVKASGILGTCIGGHEPCGVVVEVGSLVSPSEAHVGQRVMVHHYRGCGLCSACRAGWTQMCTRDPWMGYGYNVDGGHAKYISVGATTLIPLPDELSFVAGAAIACGTGTAWGALRRIGVDATHSIAIYGQGPVGLSATLLASALGARVIALDVSEDRLARARELGASDTVNPTLTDPVEAIRTLTGGAGVDRALDASGASTARRQSVQSIRPFGAVAFVGEGGDVTFDVSADLLRRQVALHGVWTFSLGEQEACARFAADRGLDLDQLFTDRWRLEQAPEAYARFDSQTAGKGVFVF
jgi:threonine dehydrogenase-like Zn-dependent dehydrogenase